MTLAGVGLVAATAAPSAGAPVAGSAGTNTALPKTDSQVTVGGRDEFSNLKITVNQTKNLVNQAVSVTWTGGKPTAPYGSFQNDYLQIMQCWGDDDGTVPANPGPPPEQCEQGAAGAKYGGVGGVLPLGFASTRIVTKKGWANFDPKLGVYDDRTGLVWKSFRSVKGEVIGVHQDPTFNPNIQGGDFWLNPYFNFVTTNEIPGAVTRSGGLGQELFEVVTGQESSGLGCGLRVQPVAGGDRRIPRCWIVVVPRGARQDENAVTGLPQTTFDGVATSPLSPSAWSHRIAFPLEFNPLDSPCSLTASQRAVAGTEMALPAIQSWQPKLCADGSHPPYAYSPISDGSARLQLQSQALNTPGIIVVSRPIDPAAVSPSNPVVYAPISLSAAVIGFVVERNPQDPTDVTEQPISGSRVATINLTPRLLAKLLTQSYTSQVAINGVKPSYDWLKTNAVEMGRDKDFLQYNPEFALLRTLTKNFGGLVMPTGTSDMARQMWDYVLGDPEARAWLDGAPDPWGMKVNPVYATKGSANPSGIPFADPVPQSFPKADPYCYQAAPIHDSIVPPALCGTDWLPWAPSLREAAHSTAVANDGARTSEDILAETAASVWKTDTGSARGTRAFLSLTDTASASQYGIQAAKLSRAGDDGSNRKFIGPDEAGLLAGVKAMKPKTDPAFLEPDLKAAVPDAYPLTTLTYAAAMPLSLDAKARGDYAAFVDYAAGPGQTPGLNLGQLPRGYVALPAALRSQTTDVAKKIRQPAQTQAATPTSSASSGVSPTAESGTRLVSGSGSPSGGAGTGASTNARALSPSTVKAKGTPSTTKALSTTVPRVQTIATPATSVAMIRLAVPVLLVVTLLSALGALEITKRPRKPPQGASR